MRLALPRAFWREDKMLAEAPIAQLMEHILELLGEHGLEDVIVTVAFMEGLVVGIKLCASIAGCCESMGPAPPNFGSLTWEATPP